MSIKEESFLPALLTIVKTEPVTAGSSRITDTIKIKDDPDEIKVEANLTCIEDEDLEGASSDCQKPDTVRDDDLDTKIKIEHNLEHIKNANLDEENKDFKLNLDKVDITNEISPRTILRKDPYQDVEDAVPFVCIRADSAGCSISVEKYVQCYVCNCKIYEDVSKNYKKTIRKLGEQYVCGNCENIVAKHELKAEFSDVEKDQSDGEEYFPCYLCEFETDQKYKLLQHMRIHTGEFACTECEYRAPLNCRLIAHMRIHTGEKPYACKLCEYKTSLKGSLRLHMRTHSGEKPYTCHLCEYRTKFKHSLQNHIRSHTGEKPYACNLCKFKSAQKSKLKDHVSIHTKGKQFSCTLCEFRTASKSNLKRHNKNSLFCYLCDYKTECKKDFTKHVKLHVKE